MGDRARNRVVQIRVTEEEKQAIERKARKYGHSSIADYGRALMIDWDSPENPQRRLDDVDARIERVHERLAALERMEGRVARIEQLAEGSSSY